MIFSYPLIFLISGLTIETKCLFCLYWSL